VSGRQSRSARAAAHAEAVRSGLWGKGVMPRKPWWMRLIAWLTPWRRKARKAEETDLRGRWYKWALKRMAAAYRARIHDREYQAFMRARAAMKR